MYTRPCDPVAPADPARHDDRPAAADRTPGSYTVHLLDHGLAKVSQKVGEEAVEVRSRPTRGRCPAGRGIGDLIFHLLVLLQARGVPFEDVLRTLESREK